MTWARGTSLRPAVRSTAGTRPAVTYWAYSGDRLNSAAQSRSGSWSNAWNTSAQPGLPKCLSPSAGGPKKATRPPGTRTRRRSHTSRFATLCVTTMTVRPSLASPLIISITDLSRPRVQAGGGFVEEEQ